MSSDIEAHGPGRKQLARKTKNSEKGYNDLKGTEKVVGRFLKRKKKLRINFTMGLKTRPEVAFVAGAHTGFS